MTLLHEHGLSIFPVRRNDKRPAVDDFTGRASRSPGIEAAIKRKGGNIGVACGLPLPGGGHLVVIDVDVKKDGFLGFAELELEHSLIEPTLTVNTPSGGRHYYFKSRAPVGNGVSKLANGVDHRGLGGYVVAPGSTIDGVSYTIETDAPIADLPESLEALMGPPGSKKKNDPVATDTGDIGAACAWLAHDAPIADEGARNATVYRVACQLRDFGLGVDTATAITLGVYNPRLSAPMDADEMAAAVRHAFTYAQKDAEEITPITTATKDFEGFGEHVEARPWSITPQPVTPIDFDAVKPVPWIVRGVAARGYTSLLIAPTSTGKSMATLQLALDVAAGRESTLGVAIVEPVKVWLINNEDSAEDLERRRAAAMLQSGISHPDIAGRLFINGAGNGLKIARRNRMGSMVAGDIEGLVSAVKAEGIGLVIVDPLVETHDGDENNNQEMGAVAGLYRRIAEETGASVFIVHHGGKAFGELKPGDINASRGASSLVSSVRIAMTLRNMSEKEAVEKGVSADERQRYVRLDDAKSNLGLINGKPRWLKKVSVAVNPQVMAGAVTPCPELDLMEAAKPVNPVIESVIQAVDPDGEKYTFDVATLLVRDNPLFAGRTAKTVEREIAKLFLDNAGELVGLSGRVVLSNKVVRRFGHEET